MGSTRGIRRHRVGKSFGCRGAMHRDRGTGQLHRAGQRIDDRGQSGQVAGERRGSRAHLQPTPADFDAGFNATPGPTFTVSANAPWTLSLRASSALWTATNTSPGAPARTTKPTADLKWSTASNGTYTAMSTTDATLVSGAATASNSTNLFFQTLYDWTLDTPGNYSLTVVLTLTAP